MDIMRNFIHVIGITPEDKLPSRNEGQMVQYSDIETIFVPEDKPPIKSIFQVMIHVEVSSIRIINAPLFKSAVIDGVKRLKIIYTSSSSLDSANLLTISTPYNTFVDIPDGYTGLDKAEVYIMDAYFGLLDSRRIYSHTIYLVHAACGKESPKKAVCDASFDPSIDGGDIIKGSDWDNHKIPIRVVDEMLIARESPIYPEILDDEGSYTGDNLVDLDSEYL